MRILIITWNYPPTRGGIEYVAGNLADGLRSLGHEVRVIAAATRARCEGDGEWVMRARWPGLVGFTLHALWRVCVRRDFAPDVILCPSVTSTPAALVRTWFNPVRLAVLFHGSDLLVRNRLYQAYVDHVCSHCDVLFANSENTQRLLRQRSVKAGIRVVYPGVRTEVDTVAPSPACREWIQEAQGRPVLLSVGRLVPRKGVAECVADVLPRVRETVPNVLYWIVGEDPGDSLIHREGVKDRIQQAIREHGLEGHVKLLGGVSTGDLAAVLARADLFVMPCLEVADDVEGFGIVMLEAAVAGTTAVGTAVGGVREAIRDGETGVLTAPGDPDGLAAAISGLLTDPERRERLARAAQQRATTLFNWHHVAGLYADGLEDAVHGRGTAGCG